MKQLKYKFYIATLMCTVFSPLAVAENWQAIDDAKILKSLLSDTVLESTLNDGNKATAEYNSDGSGVVKAWGGTFQRSWEVKGNDELCVGMETETSCFTMEKDADAQDVYRAKNTTTGELTVITIKQEGNKVTVEGPTTVQGGAAKPSANEVAVKLANPNTALASLTFKFQLREFEGTALPESQSGSGILFQPVLPFPLDNGDSIMFRPAFPLQTNQPLPGGESESGLGDIGFDLMYSLKPENGVVMGFGGFAILPTATEDALGLDTFALGPEMILAKLTKKHVYAGLVSHAWDVGGSSDKDFSLTTLTAVYVHLPGGGWSIGSVPIISYDHEANQANIPLNLTIGKTVIWGGRPWRLGVEFNYFVEKSDQFAQDWFIGINITPVVSNVLADWF
jgi:hypothetical protein